MRRSSPASFKKIKWKLRESGNGLCLHIKARHLVVIQLRHHIPKRRDLARLVELDLPVLRERGVARGGVDDRHLAEHAPRKILAAKLLARRMQLRREQL